MQPNPEQLAVLLAAEGSARKVRNAARVTRGDAWSIAIIGAITLLTGLTDISSVLLAALMAYVAWQEFAGSAALERFDLVAPRRLAWNQVIFGTGVILYSLWQLHRSMTSPSSLAQQINSDPAIAEQFGSLGEIEGTIYMAVYSAIIIASVCTQGGFAIYYETRRKWVERHLRETPPWVVEFQQRSKAR